ncbi:MAG: hypothetical protein ACI959_002277 [Limisphaerales bacterium]|jgi:hypothetical protein
MPLLELLKDSKPDIIVVIPAYKETFESLQQTIFSLENAQVKTTSKVSVLIVVNYKEWDSDLVIKESHQLLKALEELASKKGGLNLFPTELIHTSKKKGGVGSARKYGLDHGAKSFFELGKKEGLLVCLDADCTVSANYFSEITAAFENWEGSCNIHFEHPIENQSEAVLWYELHLRYFIEMQRLQQLPFAYQTFGSAIASTANEYIKEGGMNTRLAGEDFYYLHKWISKNKLKQILNATVFPSGRKSDRVPFGTGKAVIDIEKEANWGTYDFRIFELFNILPELLGHYYKTEKIIKFDNLFFTWLLKNDLEINLSACKSNTKTIEQYTDRFFYWFNGFKFLKAVHYLKAAAYPDIPVPQAINHVFKKLGLSYSEDAIENLATFRKHNCTNPYYSSIKTLVQSRTNLQ